MRRGDRRMPERLEAGRAGVAAFLTLALAFAAGSALKQAVLEHPFWSAGEEQRLQPFFPGPAVAGKPETRWSVMPVFYALGAWPREFQGQTVFYGVPYEKGPPERFVGKILAHWRHPDVEVAFLGPQTPPQYPAGIRSRDDLRSCLLSGRSETLGRWGCARLRQASLGKAVRELRALRPARWKVAWFSVENAAIPPEERAQGVVLTAEGARSGEERYILVSSRGTHQAISLRYPLTAEGEQARELLRSSIRSLRVSDELNPGRAWADRQLLGIRLKELQKLGDSPELPARLAEVQAHLIAKISVDPRSYDAYFHLGGTTLLLARYAARHGQHEWTAFAKPTIGAAFRYAKDLAPADSRTVQLEQIWVEARKF
jgi:hypothetical protein